MNRDGQLNVMAAVVSRFLMMLRANGLIRCMPSANSLIENMLGAKYMIGNVARANTLISIQTSDQLFKLIVHNCISMLLCSSISPPLPMSMDVVCGDRPTVDTPTPPPFLISERHYLAGGCTVRDGFHKLSVPM